MGFSLLSLLIYGIVLRQVCASLANEIEQVSEPWTGSTVEDMFVEYGKIFKYGNRNAASHRWVKFLLERSTQMTQERLEYMFSGFCAVSGSPVRPSDGNRYKLDLERVNGEGKIPGFMHFCCSPCVCDTQDFIRVDTRNVTTADGTRAFNFAVIGNPCEHPEELTRPFNDSFGRGQLTLQSSAPEVRCNNSVLEGAPLSDHGYVILGMFFDYPVEEELASVKFNDAQLFTSFCTDRANNGYNSGMGKIFRKVADISPIEIPSHASVESPEQHALSQTQTSTPSPDQESLPQTQAGTQSPEQQSNSETLVSTTSGEQQSLPQPPTSTLSALEQSVSQTVANTPDPEQQSLPENQTSTLSPEQRLQALSQTLSRAQTRGPVWLLLAVSMLAACLKWLE